MKIDKTDRKLLRILQLDAMLSTNDIAQTGSASVTRLAGDVFANWNMRESLPAAVASLTVKNRP